MPCIGTTTVHFNCRIYVRVCFTGLISLELITEDGPGNKHASEHTMPDKFYLTQSVFDRIVSSL